MGPWPSSGIVPWVSLNGLAGKSIKAKKKHNTRSCTSVAHATTGSVARERKCHVVNATYTESASDHSRIDPASAPHAAVNV